MTSTGPNVSKASEIALEVASLLHRLGFAAIVRDPDSADVIAASPSAEAEILAAQPGSVRIATARVAGVVVRVEIVRPLSEEHIELTPRQAAVGRLIVEGLRNREIAERLQISTHTVRRHLESIFRRLNVANRTAAATELRKGRIRLAK
jgi:DNA-binding NarL/FixJ family response regulator